MEAFRGVLLTVLADGYHRRGSGNYPQTRAALLFFHGARCAICGKPLPRHWFNGNVTATLDHVNPLSLGGFNGPGNLLPAHGRCNSRKGNRLPTGCEILQLIVVCERARLPMILRDGVVWTPPAPQSTKSV